MARARALRLWRLAWFFTLVLSLGSAQAQTPLDARIIKVEADGRVSVTPFFSPQARLKNGQRGLAVWREGERERWQVVTGPWSLPAVRDDESPVYRNGRWQPSTESDRRNWQRQNMYRR